MSASATQPQPSSQMPKIDIDKSRYDLSTYWGRVKQMTDVIDPRLLFVSDQQLQAAKDLLQKYRTGVLSGPISEEQLFQAKRITDAILHPDTKEKIPLPFRVSFFMPGNLIIVAGMLGARTVPSTIFWQGVNQTYNVCVNYANRNASNEMSNSQLLKSYAIALSSSVGTAVGLNEWVKRTTRFSPSVKQALLALVPFTAVSVANVFNISAMRWSEMTEGVLVKDKDGQALGKSAIAGQTAVAQTIFSRIYLILPGMILPPFIMNRFVDRHWLVRDFPALRTPINMLLIALIIQLSLPIGFGLFPQQGAISTDKLETKFHNLRNDKGEEIKEVFYNKGL